MNPTPDAIETVSQRLERFVAEQAHAVVDMGDDAASLVAEAAAATGGGKRLRARFCLTGWDAVREHAGAPQTAEESVIAAAAALEIFQAAALVHDDIIDNSDTRRGRPSAHRRLEAQHRDSDWAGDAARFGRSAAILLGDLLVAWSDDLFEEGLSEAAHAADARRRYGRMRRDVTLGQYLDIAAEAGNADADPAGQAERALLVATLKSARYSVQQPLLIGAELAGATPTQRQALSEFGLPIGLAFQLRDDILGVFGDAAVTGKPSGDDLREGKRTLLIAYARDALAPGARRLLDELLGDPDLDAAQIAAVQNTIVDTGALARVEADIAAYTERADRALRGAPLGTHTVGRLRDLARAATARRA
ncbi:polyprenyl synthetase family protein [Microbacterium sp.]|uniref:polyprenyl synthetase family protein n=1 Tax=Microbacterium sp. TaxID=51671 RepID=UPI003A8368A1